MDSKEIIKNNKLKALEETLTRIDKQFGKGAIMVLGKSPVPDVAVTSTGSLLLDNAIGIGGFPVGRVIEIFGPEASGKTTIALQAIAEVQAKGGVAAFIDAEHALDLQYAKQLGIKVEELLLSQPDFGEQALDIADMLVRSAAVDLIVIDSVAALVPRHELEGDMGDTHVGLQARLMSQALRKLTPLVHKSGTSLIFINQVRQNIGAMPFAPKETTTGGNALKFYASIRLDVRRIEALKEKDGSHYGNRVNIKIVKNKMAPPFKTATVNLIFGAGISRYYEIFDIAIAEKIIEQSGSWFSYHGEKICQGKNTLIAALKKDKKLYTQIEAEVIKVMHTRMQKNNETIEDSNNDDLAMHKEE